MRRSRQSGRRSGAPASVPTRTLPLAVHVLAPLAVALVTFVAFIPALGNGFVTWDDDRNLVNNPNFRGLGADQLTWMWTTFHLGHYVPLSWMSLGLDYTLWGMQPSGYHLTSMVLHAANAALLYVVARDIFKRAAPLVADVPLTLAAASTALLFAVHPLRVESVAWATERRDVLSLFFMLLAVKAYMAYVSGAVRGRLLYSLSVLAAACALLSKGTAMTLPAALFVLNIFPLGRLGGSKGWANRPAARVYGELAPFAMLALGAMVLSVVALDPPAQLPFGDKLVVSAYSLAFYLWKTVVPAHLVPLYPMPLAIHATDARYIAAFVTVAVFTAAVVFTWRRHRPIFAALLGFVVLVLPMLGIVQNGPQIAADRYTYHAAPALALLAGSVFLVTGRRFFGWVSAAAALLVVVFAALTWQQTQVWHDSVALWQRVVEEEPTSSIAHSSLASLYFDENRIPDAVDESNRALQLDPSSASAHTAVGMGLARQGQFSDAITQYQRAIALNPLDDQAENDWGIALAMSGTPAEAIQHYQRALFLNPDDAGALVNWGTALVRLGQFNEAIPHFREALSVDPTSADAQLNWGVALARENQYASAVEHFKAALAINPEHAEAREYLARASALAAHAGP